MTLLSAFDDFMSKTIQSIPGVPGRLLYLARLKSQDGQYQHWGLEQQYGREAALKAIARAHAATLTELGRAPLKDLLQQMAEGAIHFDQSAELLLSELVNTRDSLLPPQRVSITQSHVNSILSALSSLLNSSTAAPRTIA